MLHHPTNVVLQVAGCGHAVHLEAPEALVRILLRFLGTASAAPASAPLSSGSS